MEEPDQVAAGASDPRSHRADRTSAQRRRVVVGEVEQLSLGGSWTLAYAPFVKCDTDAWPEFARARVNRPGFDGGSV